MTRKRCLAIPVFHGTGGMVALRNLLRIKHQPMDEVMLDLRGLHCPQPVLRAKRALRDVPIGGVLVLECTDPLTVIDVPHFVNQTGHRLWRHERRGDLYVFTIIKQR